MSLNCQSVFFHVASHTNKPLAIADGLVKTERGSSEGRLVRAKRVALSSARSTAPHSWLVPGSCGEVEQLQHSSGHHWLSVQLSPQRPRPGLQRNSCEPKVPLSQSSFASGNRAGDKFSPKRLAVTSSTKVKMLVGPGQLLFSIYFLSSESLMGLCHPLILN